MKDLWTDLARLPTPLTSKLLMVNKLNITFKIATFLVKLFNIYIKRPASYKETLGFSLRNNTKIIVNNIPILHVTFSRGDLIISVRKKRFLMTQVLIVSGIDITTWTVSRKGERVTFSIWDFAGQTVYYNTHQVRFFCPLYQEYKPSGCNFLSDFIFLLSHTCKKLTIYATQ